MGQVVSELNGKVLDISGDEMKEGAKVVMAPKRTDDTNQKWILNPSNSTVHNLKYHPDFVWDIENGKFHIIKD